MTCANLSGMINEITLDQTLARHSHIEWIHPYISCCFLVIYIFVHFSLTYIVWADTCFLGELLRIFIYFCRLNYCGY